MLKLIYSLLILPQGADLRPIDGTLTFEDLQMEGAEGNKYHAIEILKKLEKVDMVSNIADFDEKAIGFDDIVKAAKSLIEKKGKAKGQELWTSIIEIGGRGDDNTPTSEDQALTYEDRRKFFGTLTASLKEIHNERDSVNKLKKDGNDTYMDEQ